MAHCRGCGADVWNSADTYGHILGCGYHADAPRRDGDQVCPWAMKEQHRILAEALGAAFGVERGWERADMVARALRERIDYVTRLDEDEREIYVEDGKRPLGGREAILRELDLLRMRVEELEQKL